MYDVYHAVAMQRMTMLEVLMHLGNPSHEGAYRVSACACIFHAIKITFAIPYGLHCEKVWIAWLPMDSIYRHTYIMNTPVGSIHVLRQLFYIYAMHNYTVTKVSRI